MIVEATKALTEDPIKIRAAEMEHLATQFKDAIEPKFETRNHQGGSYQAIVGHVDSTLAFKIFSEAKANGSFEELQAAFIKVNGGSAETLTERLLDRSRKAGTLYQAVEAIEGTEVAKATKSIFDHVYGANFSTANTVAKLEENKQRLEAISRAWETLYKGTYGSSFDAMIISETKESGIPYIQALAANK